MATLLNQASLAQLAGNVTVPTYDRQAITPGIIHIGVGNFHRAHQAVYLDRLFELGLDHDWGLVGAGIKSYDAFMRNKLAGQDWLTTVVELDEKGLTAKVCASMIDFIDVEAATLIAELANPQIRIVSLTITEGGYFIDEKTGGFELNHPDIQHDISHPEAPRTVFGMLVAGLTARRKAGLPPYTIMSCDNAPHNGQIARQAVVGLAEAIDTELGEWVEANIAFPSSMVDCITPATSEREKARLLDLFDIEDAAPVFCEPYRQWVLEDNFPQGRPALEQVGVQFVDDVAPFELMKLRILNGGHSAISFPAALLGLHFVHDAMNEPLIRNYLNKLTFEEIIPTLPPVPGVDLYGYATLIENRFSNPEIGDTIARLCLDGSNKLPKFILPIITANLAAGRSCRGLTLVIALWCRYCAGAGEANSAITLVDEQAERLTKLAQQAKQDPAAFLAMEDVFGSLANNAVFAAEFTRALQALWRDGTEATLGAYGS